jgi:hypothetical protein
MNSKMSQNKVRNKKSTCSMEEEEKEGMGEGGGNI